MTVTRSVAKEMGKFAIAYIPLLIGFLMMFMILFSDHKTFNTNNLGVIGKVKKYHIKTNCFPGSNNDDWRD